ncbi:MAG: hypothetical protein VBE63_23985 [Lamprobacter sp.]|uniref:hypothetical protein n=1 Tax=Lamprobacter sp. TaxID=3100796 RepID=UPI002B264250|nr:hypothetical protein [Lamprobacter sp.]MEA3642976.1 hypothetical protein [Lamprobacter sp.]
MRIFFYYLLISGFVAHMVGVAVFLHFQSTGASLYRYLSKGIEYLDHDSSRSRHIARFAQFVMLDSGLVTDPKTVLSHDVDFKLPIWEGNGASALRLDTAPRYTSQGEPVPSADKNRWLISKQPELRVVKVGTVDALTRALEAAEPGTQIELEPGHYRLNSQLMLGSQGLADAPIVLRGSDIESTILTIEDGAGFLIDGSFWTLSDLIVRGQCSEGSCPWLVRIEGKADHFTVRNLFVSGVERLITAGFDDTPPLEGLTEGVTLVGGELADVEIEWPEYAIRRLFIDRLLKNGLVTLCSQDEAGPGCDSSELSDAIKRVSPGGVVLMRSGVYKQAATIGKADIHILAEPGARLYRKTIQGKGALVVRANVVIEGLTCSHIKVGDGNGCCVRQERGDVTLLGVHFHHAQMGMLTGHNGGEIKIFDSYFHDSGYDESGNLGHNLYVNSGTLSFVRSWSLSARNAGHEIKSRADVTVIRDSLVASLNARDSRLIDLPNGGVFLLTGSILGEGPGSENWDLIGYGLEGLKNGAEGRSHRVTIRRNTFYIDRERGGKLLNTVATDDIEFRDNVIIGGKEKPPGNTYYGSRSKAAVGDYPVLKALTF